jgi:TRAP transporter TAXI family solute receptor
MRRTGNKLTWVIATMAAGLLVLAGVVSATFINRGLAQSTDAPQRIAFQIATGSVSGKYFPMGEMLAGLLSHPPGIARCDTDDVCGPPGVIVSTRASEGSTANILAVDRGSVDSGLAQADVVALAIAGKGAFKKMGPARNLRVIANLYPEDVHLVVSTKSRITSVAGLKGKRVSLSTRGSGTLATAETILAAYRVSEKSIKPNYDSIDKAVELLQAGKLDALFFVGGTPVHLIDSLIANKSARLVAIDGEGRKRLLAAYSFFAADKIPWHTYAGAPAVETVSVGALWITNASEPNDLVYAMVKALYNRANRATLERFNRDARFVQLETAAQGTAASFHPGALRYYKQAGVLPKAIPPKPARKP